MALERDDLDELNRPAPRRIRAVLGNTGEGGGGERVDGRMSEPTVGELLLSEVRDMKKILSDAMTEQAKMRVQVDMHETAIRDLNAWRDDLPEKRRERQQQEQTAWWQTTNGKINIALFALVILTTIAPFIAAHWH